MKFNRSIDPEYRIENYGRIETRNDRINRLLKENKKSKIELCCINIGQSENIGMLCRNLVYWGGNEFHIIGNNIWPKKTSCNTHNFVNVINYRNPLEFINWWKKYSNKKLVSLELTENSIPITNYEWDEDIILCVGSESTGVPVEILNNSDIIKIPVQGHAPCLNLSVAAGIAINQWASKYLYE